MKKNLLTLFDPNIWGEKNKKQSIMMRRLFLICIMMLFAFSGIYSQNVNLNLTMKNVTVEQVLQEIKKQNNYDFIYDAD